MVRERVTMLFTNAYGVAKDEKVQSFQYATLPPEKKEESFTGVKSAFDAYGAKGQKIQASSMHN